MIAVLVRLQWMTLKGRVLRSIRLLRQPKYLVGFIVGFVWISLSVIRPFLRTSFTPGPAPFGETGAALLPVIHRFVALVVAIALPLPWLLPWGRLGLPFREAELTMLLQAPLTRRAIIQYGLLKSEVGIVISALVSGLVFGGGGLATKIARFAGTWILFEFWHLNGKWRAVFNLRQTEIPPASARWRRIVVTGGLLIFYAALLGTALPFLASLRSALTGDFESFVASVSTVEWPPTLVTLLAPAWGLTAPMFAGAGTGFFVAAVPALLLVVAQRELVLRTKARFEEGSLEHARRQETRKSPGRRFERLSSRARSSAPFELSRRGPPVPVLVWKNLLRVTRMRWTRVVLAAAGLLLAIGLLPAVLRLPDVMYVIVAAVGGVMMLVPPVLVGMTWNNDLRTELPHIELVRTWPVPVHRFVLAHVLSPALLSVIVSTVGAGIVFASLFGPGLRHAITGEPPSLDVLSAIGDSLGVWPALGMALLIFSVLPLVAAISFLSSALQNLATLFVPAWTVHGVDRGQGLAVFGRQMVFSWALALVLLLAMLPSALLVGGAALAQKLLGIPWSAWVFPLWGVLAAAPVAAGGWGIVHAAGRLWERLDPSQEMLEIGR